MKVKEVARKSAVTLSKGHHTGCHTNSPANGLVHTAAVSGQLSDSDLTAKNSEFDPPKSKNVIGIISNGLDCLTSDLGDEAVSDHEETSTNECDHKDSVGDDTMAAIGVVDMQDGADDGNCVDGEALAKVDKAVGYGDDPLPLDIIPGDADNLDNTSGDPADKAVDGELDETVLYPRTDSVSNMSDIHFGEVSICSVDTSDIEIELVDSSPELGSLRKIRKDDGSPNDLLSLSDAAADCRLEVHEGGLPRPDDFDDFTSGESVTLEYHY